MVRKSSEVFEIEVSKRNWDDSSSQDFKYWKKDPLTGLEKLWAA